MKHLASPKAVAAGCVLVAVTNVVIVASAAWNRRGAPRAELALTERELALPEGRRDERSGLMLDLRLTHDVPGPVRRTARWRGYDLPLVSYSWLDRAKLADLGFRTDLDPADPSAAEAYARQLPRPVYLVLEFDGEAWRRWLAAREEGVAELRRRAENDVEDRGALADAEALLELDRTMRSRLFPVDAGLDPGALRSRYGDRGRYAVLEASIRPKVVTPEGGVPALGGTVLDPIVGSIHVPGELGIRLEPFLPAETFEERDLRERREAQKGWPAAVAPRFRAELAVGRRFEPWLLGITALDADAGTPAKE